MKKNPVRKAVTLIPFLLILIGFYLAGLGQSQFTDVDVELIQKNTLTNHETKQKTRLPYLGRTNNKTISTFIFDFDKRWYHESIILIKPDDCLVSVSVNGQPVNLSPYRSKLCDIGNGVNLDLKEYLTQEKNQMEITVDNRGGYDHGLKVETQSSAMESIGFAIVLLGVLVTVFMFRQRFQFSYLVYFLFAFSVLLRFYYFDQTTPHQRAHDVGGHIEHINKVRENWERPEKNACWQCYHPPVYYFSTAVYTEAVSVISDLHPERAMQSFSLFASVVFLIYGILILRIVLPARYQIPGIILFLFWPASIMYAARIGNDALLYVSQAMGLYYLLRWDGEKNKHLFLSLLCWAVGVFVKTNAILLIVPIAVRYIFIRRKKIHELLKISMAKEISLIAIIVMGTMSVIVYDRWKNLSSQVDQKALVVGNYKDLPGNIRLHNSPEKMVLFDSEDYFAETYTSPFGDRGGRQYYWNFMIKTSLFGEFDHGYKQEVKGFVFILKLLFVVGILLAAYGVFSSFHKAHNYKYTLITYGAVLLFASMMLRWQIPVAPSQDFRYIYPIVFVFIPFLFTGYDKVFRRYSQTLSYITSIVLAICTSYFYITVI